MGLETMRLAVYARGGLAVRSVHEAEHLAGLLVDPVMLVVDPVLTLDLEVRLVSAGDIGRLDPGDVVDIQVRRHADLLRTASMDLPIIVRHSIQGNVRDTAPIARLDYANGGERESCSDAERPKVLAIRALDGDY